jgi:hypothetical protein
MKTLAKIHVGRSPSSEPDSMAGGAVKTTAETRWKFKSPTVRSFSVMVGAVVVE